MGEEKKQPPPHLTRTHPMRPSLLVTLLFALSSCVTQTPPALAPRGLVRPGTPDAENLALARAREQKQLFLWEAYSPDVLARARATHKFILLTGAASWCHWCHVMEQTTYRDPRVGKLLAEKFITLRVDIDENPDFAERYSDWGWPATILLTPDAEEIGKHAGYMPPDELLPILEEALKSETPTIASIPDPAATTASVSALPWIAARAAIDMDSYFDGDEGSWGKFQKLMIGPNILFELRRFEHKSPAALGRVKFTLEKQRALLDPVWGGVYQYSAGSTWDKPHYEKLMTYQAENLEAYSLAYKTTGKAEYLHDAHLISRYLTTFLSNADSAFLVSQDADVGAHDETSAFVDGDVYYRRDDAGRRALGIPHVDDHVYAYENGLAIAALCALFEAAGEKEVLARAERAAALILTSHVEPDGAVKHDAANASKKRYLADAASFGRALVRLFEVTKKETYRDAALRIATTMEKRFLDETLKETADVKKGAYFLHTADPTSVGVFSRRQQGLPTNILAARFLAGLFRITGDSLWLTAARRTLAAAATPRATRAQGRMVGEFLLSLDEAGAYPWNGDLKLD